HLRHTETRRTGSTMTVRSQKHYPIKRIGTWLMQESSPQTGQLKNMPVKSGTSAKHNNITPAGMGSDARIGCCHITYSLPPSRRFSSSLEWSSSTRMMETE